MGKEYRHKQVSEEEVRIMSREEWEKLAREEACKKQKYSKSEGNSFAASFVYYMEDYGCTLIANAPVKAELRDPNGGLIKTFTSLNALTVDVEGDRVFIRVRIIDSSTDSYTFRYLKVWARRGEENFTAIYHTFSTNYTKGSDQIADITVRTGIGGCYLG